MTEPGHEWSVSATVDGTTITISGVGGTIDAACADPVTAEGFLLAARIADPSPVRAAHCGPFAPAATRGETWQVFTTALEAVQAWAPIRHPVTVTGRPVLSADTPAGAVH